MKTTTQTTKTSRDAAGNILPDLTATWTPAATPSGLAGASPVDPRAARKPAEKGILVECLERFTFKDGVRLAYVTWRIGDGERQAVSVREL